MQIYKYLCTLFSKRHKSISLCITLIISSLLTPFCFPMNVSAASAPKLKQATFTLDSMKVLIASNALPPTTFIEPAPDNLQIAKSITNNPYHAFFVSSISYGTQHGTDLPVAQPGGASAYRDALKNVWQEQTQAPQTAPTIELFGSPISGTLYHIYTSLDSFHKSHLLVSEWVTEAYSRLWIVRNIQEDRPGTLVSMTKQIQGTTITAQATSPTKKTLTITPQTTSSTINLPSVWGGNTCDNVRHPGSLPLPGNGTISPAVLDGVVACGKLPRCTAYHSPQSCNLSPYTDIDNNADLGESLGGATLSEWECVEFSMRYMYQVYNIAPYGGPNNGSGQYVVDNYQGTKLQKHLTYGSNVIGSTNPIGKGDILSFGVCTVSTCGYDEFYGHTSVVANVTWYDNAGNGYMDVIEQNNSPQGISRYTIRDWTLQVSSAYYAGNLRGWLHNPNGGSGGTTPPPNYKWSIWTYAGRTTNGSPEVYARGSDNNIWHNYLQSNNTWSGWSPLQSGGQFAGDPAVGHNPNGVQEVFARGVDNNIWHIWQNSPDGPWVGGWSPLSTSSPGFQGTPVVGYTTTGQLEVYARGSDNNIYHNYKNADGNWVGWSPLQSGGQFAGDPMVGRNPNGVQEVFARGVDNNIWHIWQNSPDGPWVGGWSPLSTSSPGFQGTPAVGYTDKGQLEVYARGADNNIYHNYKDANGNWIGWGALQSGGQFRGDPIVWVNGNGGQEVFAIGWNNNVWHIYQSAPDGLWGSSWGELQPGQSFQGSLAIDASSDKRLEVFGLNSDNNIYHIWQGDTNGVWTSWTPLQTGSVFQQ